MSISQADRDEAARTGPSTANDGPSSADDGSIRGNVTRLIAAGKELAEAEFAWARAKGAVVADGLRKWVMLAALALIFLVMGVTLLIVSAIIALIPLVGLLISSLIVAGLSLLAALICTLAARRILNNLFAEEAP
ncbi:MAG TPA: phage holin family protein [Sphingobium sp.]|nr:phage holin family protein [Sphingobium sp.]